MNRIESQYVFVWECSLSWRNFQEDDYLWIKSVIFVVHQYEYHLRLTMYPFLNLFSIRVDFYRRSLEIKLLTMANEDFR